MHSRLFDSLYTWSLSLGTALLGIIGPMVARVADAPNAGGYSAVGAIAGMVALALNLYYRDRRDARGVDLLNARLAAKDEVIVELRAEVGQYRTVNSHRQDEHVRLAGAITPPPGS